MPLVIHFGVRESEFDVFRNQLTRLVPSGIDPIKDFQDQWDSSFTESLLDEPVHVTITTLTPMVILHFLTSHFDNFLMPLSGQERDGVKIYVTDSNENRFDDEIQEYIEFRWPE